MILKENDPRLDSIISEIESELSDQDWRQNFSLDIEPDWNENDDIIGLQIKVECNVDWTDREGRHPWMEKSVTVDFENMTMKGEATLESKDGRIDESAEDESTFTELTQVADFVVDMLQEMEYEMDNNC